MEEYERPNPDALLRKITHEERQRTQGRLKIFFGYSAGVGKTFAMLEEAQMLLREGVDIVVGYVERHQRPDTLALLDGLPQIPPLEVKYKSATFYELDLDAALKRKPEVIIVDELAHTNAEGCRNVKRYQDIQELLRMGIDVYTTVNAQHIEGLNDKVEAITGIAVRERVPDDVFDSADKVELVDIEPEDLVERLQEGKVYKNEQAKRALQNFFTKENLAALREISLRRTADRLQSAAAHGTKNVDGFINEHILMCLSSSPSNAKIVRTAANMAKVFNGTFTALFVETSDFEKMSEENKARLREHRELAEQLGAKIVTVYGDDVPYQLAEYAKVSGASKVIIGRSVRRTPFLGFAPPTLTDKLIAYAPNLDVYVIPNKLTRTFEETQKKTSWLRWTTFSWPSTLRMFLYLAIATLTGHVFETVGLAEVNIITMYILAAFIIAAKTRGRTYSVLSSLFAVILFNFFFVEPRYTFNIQDSGYIATFLIMFIVAFVTSVTAKRMDEYARQLSFRTYRTEVLLETSQKIQQAKTRETVLLETVNQINKLLGRECFAYMVNYEMLDDDAILAHDEQAENMAEYMTAAEYAVAQWVFINNKAAGATTDTLSGAKCLYMAIREKEKVFAVVGIPMNKYKKIEPFDKGLLISILDESAMVLEKDIALEEKNKMEMHATNEQLRANLLRAISHDLRTPLTSIAGGSEFLLERFDNIDKETLHSMLSDISNDAQWMSSLVENLLNMTRIQDGRLTVNKTPELVEELLTAATSKVIKRAGQRKVDVKKNDADIFVHVDAQLMIQVIVNVLDNAFKHTVDNCNIEVSYRMSDNNNVTFEISDNGGGIAEDQIGKVFDMFFTSPQNGGDKQRGMGLGLSICKSIVEAHDGTIKAENNPQGGATFLINLPLN